MCTYSMIVDHYRDKWNQPNEWWKNPNVWPPQGGTSGIGGGTFTPSIVAPPAPTAEEIAEFRRLLDRAREYDKKNNQPDCELEIKKDVLRQMAKAWGIDISFIDKEE